MSQLSYSFFYNDPLATSVTFTVLKFSGFEALSSVYEMKVMLYLADANQLPDLIDLRAGLVVEYNAVSVRTFHGIITEIEDVKYSSSSDGSVQSAVIQVMLKPEIIKLGYCKSNEIYPRTISSSGEDITATITTIMQDLGWTASQEYRLSLTGTHRNWKFRLQYGETTLDFLHRILQREGIFYFFEEGTERERIVFTDNNNCFPAMTPSTLRFVSNQAATVPYENDVVQVVNSVSQSTPLEVRVSNFNDETPSTTISQTQPISTAGHGTLDVFGENVESSSEATDLATIYANSYICRQKKYLLETNAYSVSVGAYVMISGHPRSLYNSVNLVFESLIFEGAVEADLLVAEIAYDGEESFKVYCTALEKSLTYGPEQTGQKPTIQGTLLGEIDGSAGQATPQLDSEGRYRVKFLFDQRTRTAGACSHYIRKSEVYGGDGEGMHFPLIVGSRVLVGFIEGDPDRPLIVGTLTDSGVQQSVVNSSSSTENKIISAGGNSITLDDTANACAIEYSLPGSADYIKLSQVTAGTGKGYELMTDGIEQRHVLKGQNLRFATQYIAESDNQFSFPRLNYHGQAISAPTISSLTDWQSLIGPTFGVVGSDYDIKAEPSIVDRTSQTSIDSSARVFSATEEQAGHFIFEKRYGHRFEWSRGNRYIFGEDRLYDFGNAYEEYHTFQEGIDINEEYFDIPPVTNALYSASAAAPNWYDCSRHDRAVDPGDHSVFKRWGDQFCYHYGRRFEWCDAPADYNFSNGYTENLIISNTETINADHPHDAARPSGPNYNDISGSLVSGLISGETIATKTVGNTYDYRRGQNLSIVVGNSEEKVYGDTFSKVTGDSESEIHGSDKVHYYGGSESHHHGAAGNYYMGAFSDMYLGLTSSMHLGVSNSMHVGAVSDMFAGLHLKLNLSYGLEVNVSSGASFDTLSIDSKGVHVGNAVTDVENNITTLVSAMTKIRGVLHEINNRGIALESGQVSIRTKITAIQTSALVNIIS